MRRSEQGRFPLKFESLTLSHDIEKYTMNIIVNSCKEVQTVKEYFFYHDRLGIHLPAEDLDWDDLSDEIKAAILLRWEGIRGAIPDRIQNLEKIINKKQAQLSDESDFK